MFDINTPVTNPELVAAIVAVQKEINAETQGAYFRALKRARFLSPVTIEPRPKPEDAEGKTTLEVDTTISFMFFIDAIGDHYLPVYTDWSALKQWRDVPDEQTLTVHYDDVSDVVLKNPKTAGFVINPYSHNIPVRRDMIDHLNAESVSQWSVEQETSVCIGAPNNDPVALKEAVARYLKSQKNIKSACLVLMEKDGEFSFLMVIDFIGDSQTVFHGIASVAVPELRQGELIDMVPADSELGQQVMQDYPPFYKRKIFGLF